ncbi:hypothetical protein SU69_02265 [Thermosipho melanesiensis]|uniref:Outer membrane protein beta-barrel domain-containing protein n=2 Tax=Thermosipho melanesiensis TaxID=46541 RepID=A6LK52_THEM4|nr:hypothetical protein [Thermosipho melanesiensis]ABR30303.1 hypothetical protein Tmel_0436 [Thermosipho melanesiensis BI429]APT74822.1 hypothetical protein BW47_02370 [Thermosipho melanesiensis]OOC37425.1 hypothetical protein SU68_02275 [Thermosipho melanesiensis]OOC39787.1 hypothetical protein SU69_02265 [Thermosipho melanesiensis]OOC39892.1 hypothetical protein SU70_02260 [Thermosipho melanesiensis]
MRYLLLIFLILSVSVFPFFLGVEGLTLPQIDFPEYPAPQIELFARMDLGLLYFMLPFGTYNEDGSVFIVNNIDAEYIKRFLGVGLQLTPNFSKNFYMRLSTDMPIIEAISIRQFNVLDLKVGLGLKFAIFKFEAGAVGRMKKLTDGSLGMKFGEIFYFAGGFSF